MEGAKMLSIAEINIMLKENFTRQLQDTSNLPEDIANGYKNWVHGLINAAIQKMQPAQAAPQQEEVSK